MSVKQGKSLEVRVRKSGRKVAGFEVFVREWEEKTYGEVVMRSTMIDVFNSKPVWGVGIGPGSGCMGDVVATPKAAKALLASVLPSLAAQHNAEMPQEEV